MSKKPARESASKIRRSRFVDEYLIDLNATQAAIRAGYGAKCAAQTGHELLRNPDIQAMLTERRQKMAENTEITPESVIKRWWEIATADPNELTSLERRCCRHCYGEGHAYQWIDADDYERACSNANMSGDPMPTDEGGYGFDPRLTPHAKCPKCFGDGSPYVHLADTRNLSPAAKALFDGVKETRFGIEVKMQDRARALENVAKHLGMFKVDVNHGVQDGNPLLDFLNQVAGTGLKPREQPENDE